MTEGDRPFVKEAVRSAVQQTVPCAIIVMASTENDWIEATLGELAAKVTVCRLPLQPVGLVRNRGVSEARTEWVAFLDGDDLWLPEKTARQLAWAKANGLQASGARHILVRTDGTPYFYAFAKTMPLPSSYLFTRDLIIREPFTDLRQWEDSELWKRLLKLGVAGTMRKHLIHYRVREGSLSSSFAPAKRQKQELERWASNAFLRSALLWSSRVLAQVITPRQ